MYKGGLHVILGTHGQGINRCWIGCSVPGLDLGFAGMRGAAFDAQAGAQSLWAGHGLRGAE